MADEKNTAGAVEQKKKLPEYDKDLAAKYDISSNLQPSKVDLGSRFGKVEIDLRTPDSLAQVDDFVEKFKDQKFFTLKKKAEEKLGDKK